ncbi:uroporphyrinogen-III C-methyltransferase [Alienimonas chondri]|uniref:uroporphyrinogen-III C-methyltransferase n=1 Tax=Alienimonas chondri TaxID=2681879 RepID=A0ABX1VDZ7_9PLAN|nr:uroporphyrinogen-III C-methyltransferase [Alienimonas chondri]NNJ26319.1 Siroheme synthase [Alienimonas chondri]
MASTDSSAATIPTVHLVGAGPGDAGLLTRRGEALLVAADVVLADALVGSDVLALASPDAEIVTRTHAATDAPGTRETNQQALIARMIAEAKAGRRVVRLKGGDPSIFGRGTEEADALLAAGVPVEVVPGVTAAIAASGLSGIPLTHRDHAGAVCFVTGHDAGRRRDGIDWAALAAFPGTRVFYMGRGRLRKIAAALIAHGLPPDTPAAVVSKAATSDQRTVCGAAATIADDCAAADLPGPAVLLVGGTATAPGARGWWERRPLHGVAVAMISAGMPDGVEDRLRNAGADIHDLQLLATWYDRDQAEFDAALDALGPGDAIAFTSKNGVGGFHVGLFHKERDVREFCGVRFACVGPSTAESLRLSLHLNADLVPEEYSAEQLAAALAPHVTGKKVLWPTCPEAKSTLADRLTEAGADVRRVHVYRQEPATELPADFAAKLDAGNVDWALIASGNLARTFAELSKDSPGRDGLKVAAISENVATAGREAGLNVAAVAADATWDGLVEAVCDAAVSEARGAEQV